MSLLKKERRIAYFALMAGIGFLFLFPGIANAISNEQLVGGYHYEPCNTMYGRHGSIDSDGADIVAAFVTQRGYAGPYNVVLARSIDNGANWQGHTYISTSEMDQWYPDIVMLDIPDEGKVVFVVWQETNNPVNSDSDIKTKAVYFDDFTSNWYGVHTIHDGFGTLSNYPRIAGTITDCAETGGVSYDLLRIHFVWEEYSNRGGYPHYEIWGSEYYWENYGAESSNFGNIDYMAYDDCVDLRHPSIDADVAVGGENGIGNIEHLVLTFDCKWRDYGTVDVRYKYFAINGVPNIAGQAYQGKGTLIFTEQNTHYSFPDITIWGETEDEETWNWEIVIVGQKIGSLGSNYIAGRASIDLGSNWGSVLNVGSMGSTEPELRGVAIDSGLPADGEEEEWERFEDGITVIWDVDDVGMNPCTEIWSRQLRLSGNTLIVIDLDDDNAPEVDTSGIYGGDLTYVAISYTTIIDEGVVGYSHNLYNGIVFQAADPLWAGDVIYYTNP